MADIATSIELRDPLAGTSAVTGPQYMEALGRLGYNIETMSNPAIVATKNFQAASSLLTNVYQQQLDWQKAQAETAYNVAQSKHLDSITQYNNDTLGLREHQLVQEDTLRGLDISQKQRQQKIDDANLENAIAAEAARLKDVPTVAKLNELKLGDEQRKSDLNAEAAGLADEANKALPKDGNDPDYDAKMASWWPKYAKVWSNGTTGPAIQARIAANERQRQNLVDFTEQNQDKETLLDLRHSGDLAAPVDIQGILNDKVARHTAIVGGQIARNIRLAGEYAPQLRALGMEAEAQQLEDFMGQAKTILTRGQDGLNELRTGAWGDLFDANGNLNAHIQGLMNSARSTIETYAAGKGPEIEVEKADPSWKPNPLNPSERAPRAKITKVPLSQKAQVEGWLDNLYKTPEQKQKEDQAIQRGEQAKKAAGISTSTTPGATVGLFGQETASLGREMATIFAREPQLKEMYDAARAPGAPPELMQRLRAYMRNRYYGLPTTGGAQQAVVGMQSGGQAGQAGTIFNPASVGAGSTDTVPAMLTPGEYVVSKPAVDAVGKDTLDQINQGGGVASSIKLENPLASIASQMGGQTGQRQQPQQQPSDTKTASAQPETKPWWQGGTPWYGKQPTTESTSSPETATAPAAAAVGAAAAASNPNLARSPSQVEPSSPIGGGWKSGIGTEFGEVDNPVYGGYTEPGWDRGAGGAKISGWGTKGVALRNVPLGTVVEVMNTQTGKIARATVVDHGPNPKTGAAIDMTGGTRAELGFARNFRGPVQYRIISAMQHGGVVQEEGSIGTGPGRGGGGGRGGGIEQQLDQPSQPSQRHRRFHPRLGAAGGLGAIGSDIPDPMQKKLSKLSQDFLGGLSDLIKQKPEIGPSLLKHARNQLAANLGSEEGDQQQESSVPAMQQMRVPPEAYGGGMMAYGGPSEGEGTAYMQGGGSVMPEDSFNKMMLDPEASGINFQGGGEVKGRVPGGKYVPPDPGIHSNIPLPWVFSTDPMEPGWQPGFTEPVMPGGPAPWDDYSLAQLTHSHSLLTNMLAQRASS